MGEPEDFRVMMVVHDEEAALREETAMLRVRIANLQREIIDLKAENVDLMKRIQLWGQDAEPRQQSKDKSS